MSFSVNRGRKNARNAYTKKRPAARGKERAFSWRFPAARCLPDILGSCLWVFLGGAVLFAVCVGMLRLYHIATTSPFFMTRHIEVTGNERLTREMVLEMTGLELGKNSLAVNLSAVERTLLGSPWVEEVSVQRLLPDGFVLHIRERKPSFWVRKEGILWYADMQGTIIAPVERTGFLSLPTLSVEAGVDDVLPHLEEFLQDVRAGRLPVEFGDISGITLSPGRGMELYLEDRDMRLSVAVDDWRGNLERLLTTLGDLARRNELGTVREVRASDGSVWVITSGPGMVPSETRSSGGRSPKAASFAR